MVHAAERLWRALYADGDAVREGQELVLYFMGAPDQQGRRQKRAAWATSLGGALAALEEPQFQGLSAYFHLALHDRVRAQAAAHEKDRAKGRTALRPLARVRGANVSAAALGGLWADFDVASADHERAGLPATREEILRKLRACPLVPSHLVYTGGGGVHAYWRLREVLTLDAESGPRAAALVRGWTLFLKQAMGLAPDSAHDFARVLRVPGMMDPKRGVLVELAHESEAAYNPSDFEDLSPEGQDLFSTPRASSGPARVVDGRGLTLDPQAAPPWPKLTELLALDARFAATWKRERKDLSEQSQSCYDMALANQLVSLGWTDQEVVDTLIYHRAVGGQKEKLRPDYYATTLGKCRRDTRAEAAYRQLEDAAALDVPVAPAPASVASTVARSTSDATVSSLHSTGSPSASPASPPRTTPPGTLDRAQVLRALSDALGVDLQAVIKYPIDGGSSYAVVVAGQRHTLGGVNEILDARSFRSRLADIARVVVRPYKPAQWTPLAKMMLQVLDEEDLGAESNPRQMIEELVSSYLAARLPRAADGTFHVEHTLVAGEREPFYDARSGCVALHLIEFASWVRLRLGIEYTQKKLGQMLRGLGARPHTFSALPAGANADQRPRTTTSAWLVPREVFEPEPPPAAPAEAEREEVHRGA